MKILSRYIAGTYLKFWLLSLVALLLLVVISNLFGNLDSALSSKAGLLAFLDETVRSMPTVLDLLIPMTALLAVLFTFTGLARSSELVAMQSVGMGLYRQLRPIAFVLVMIAALDYVNQNYLFRLLQPPESAHSTRNVAHQWTVLRNHIIHASRINAGRARIADVSIFTWSPEPFRLDRVERAQRVGRRVEARRSDRATDRAQHPHEDEHLHDDPAGVDTTKFGRFRIAAEGKYVAAETGPRGEESDDKGRAKRDQDGDRDTERNKQPALRPWNVVRGRVLAGEPHRHRIGIDHRDGSNHRRATDSGEREFGPKGPQRELEPAPLASRVDDGEDNTEARGGRHDPAQGGAD